MPFFDIFASPRWSPLRMRTKLVSFFFFPRAFKQKKIKALRPNYDQMHTHLHHDHTISLSLLWPNRPRLIRSSLSDVSANIWWVQANPQPLASNATIQEIDNHWAPEGKLALTYPQNLTNENPQALTIDNRNGHHWCTETAVRQR